LVKGFGQVEKELQQLVGERIIGSLGQSESVSQSVKFILSVNHSVCLSMGRKRFLVVILLTREFVRMEWGVGLEATFA